MFSHHPSVACYQNLSLQDTQSLTCISKLQTWIWSSSSVWQLWIDYQKAWLVNIKVMLISVEEADGFFAFDFKLLTGSTKDYCLICMDQYVDVMQKSSMLHFSPRCLKRPSMNAIDDNTDDAAPWRTPWYIRKLSDNLSWNIDTLWKKHVHLFQRKQHHFSNIHFHQFL